MHPDYQEDLGNEYTFVHESAVHQTIFKNKLIIEDTAVTIGIGPCVVDYENGRRFVLVSQIPIPDSVFFSSSPVVDQYIADTKERNYWIVDKERDSLYGPMDIKQFTLRKILLKIPRQ